MPKTMEIFWISRCSHFEEKIIFFKKITDYQQFSPVNDMLSTLIGKGYIILINDKSLWGETRFAKCRFPLLHPNPVTLFITSGSKSP